MRFSIFCSFGLKMPIHQGRPVNVKHGARCAMDKVGPIEGKKKPKEGEIFLFRGNQLTVFHNNGLNTKNFSLVYCIVLHKI